MAFTLANWCCISEGLNQGQETVTPFGGSPTVLNAPNVFFYGSPNDTVATITAANYFLSEYVSLSVGDWIMGNGTDASFAVVVTAVSSTSVTVASTGLTTSIGTANIVDDAVTYAKLQDAVANNVLLGNPGGGASAEYVEVPLGNGLQFSAGALQVPNNLLRFATVNITAAQWNGMYAAPVQLLAAPGAGLMNVIDHLTLNMTFVSASYAAGGVVGAEYGATAHLAGPAASATEAAADFNAAGANTMFRLGGGLGTGVATASTINAVISLSNTSGAFTTGDGTWVVDIWYKTISAN